MKTLKIGAALLAAAALIAGAKADWTSTARQTPEGTFVLGNPAAPQKLVEYASYTCNHCATFAGEAAAPLEAAVASGKVSVEFRHALRDPLDLAAAVLARCAGPARFFAASNAIFAAQDALFDKAEKVVPPAGADPVAAAKAYAAGSGLLPIVARHGVTPARAEQCLSDRAEYGRLRAMTDEAWGQRKIPGTPHFLINGAPVDANSWAALAPRLTN